LRTEADGNNTALSARIENSFGSLFGLLHAVARSGNGSSYSPRKADDHSDSATSFGLCTPPARKSTSILYAIGLEKDEAWRREWCERAGLGFSLVGLLGLQKLEDVASTKAA
jgi:hypothetical protein